MVWPWNQLLAPSNCHRPPGTTFLPAQDPMEPNFASCGGLLEPGKHFAYAQQSALELRTRAAPSPGTKGTSQNCSGTGNRNQLHDGHMCAETRWDFRLSGRYMYGATALCLSELLMADKKGPVALQRPAARVVWITRFESALRCHSLIDGPTDSDGGLADVFRAYILLGNVPFLAWRLKDSLQQP